MIHPLRAARLVVLSFFLAITAAAFRADAADQPATSLPPQGAGADAAQMDAAAQMGRQLVAEVEALREQLSALEAKVDRMEAERSTVKAPFTIQDAQGAAIFTVGIDTQSGKVRLVLGDVGGANVTMGLAGEGGGSFLSLITPGGQEGAALLAQSTGNELVISNAQGKPIFSAGEVQQKPSVTIGDPSGPRIELGAREGETGMSIIDGDMDAKLGALAPASGGRSMGMSLSHGQTELAALTAGQSGGVLTTFDSKGTPVLTVSNAETDPLTLFDTNGKAMFAVGLGEGSGMPTLTVGTDPGPRVRIGVAAGGDGSFVTLLDKAGNEGAALIADATGNRVMAADDKGEEVFSAGLVQQKAALTLGTATGARLQAGVLKGGDGSYLSLIDGGGDERTSISATAAETLLTLSDKNMQVDLGSYDEDRYGLLLSKDGDIRANLRFSTDGGGAVNVATSQGKLVAGLIAGDDGGHLVATGSQGGANMASLAGSDEGGRLSLYDPQGQPLVYGEATGKGTFQLLNASGNGISMTTGESAPRLELTVGGEPLVQMAITTDSVGIVRAGPAGNGAAGTLGAGLKPASSIQGTTK